MSAHWIASNYRYARLICIDTFEGSDEHKGLIQATELEQRFDHNLAPFKDRVLKIVGKSGYKLRELQIGGFDVIYIDGDHHAQQVLEDAVLAFPLLKDGGIMIFDDYPWRPLGDFTKFDCPGFGIDSFLAMYEGKYNLLHKEYQVIIQKKLN